MAKEEKEYAQIKESIVEFLEKNSESEFTYKQIGDEFLLFPAQVYYILSDLVKEERIRKKGIYYSIKKQQ